MKKINYLPSQSTPFSRKIKFKSLLWQLINQTAYRWSPFFCRGFRRNLVRLFGGKIARTASLNRTCKIDFPWNVEIGEFSSSGANSWIYALDKIVVGEKTCIGDGVKLLTGSHRIDTNDFALVTLPVHIGSCCWISTACTVLPGVTINDGAVVAACAVVTKEVEAWTVVAGNPAKPIKKRVLIS